MSLALISLEGVGIPPYVLSFSLLYHHFYSTWKSVFAELISHHRHTYLRSLSKGRQTENECSGRMHVRIDNKVIYFDLHRVI